MEKLTLYQYFLLRSERHTDSIVQDLVDDMMRDDGIRGSGGDIVVHILFFGNRWVKVPLRQFLCAYRAYCKRKGYEYEKEAFDEMKKWR